MLTIKETHLSRRHVLMELLKSSNIKLVKKKGGQPFELHKCRFTFLDNYSYQELISFLDAQKSNLRENLLRSSKKRLDSYLANSEEITMILHLGLYKIEVHGEEDALVSKKSIVNVFEKY